MMFSTLPLGVLVLLQAALTTAAPPVPRLVNDYAPRPTVCPTTQLVRPGNGISPAEANFISQRYAKANVALETWLKKIDKDFKIGNNRRRPAPVIGLTSSGGGYRAQLTGGGVVKGFDGRENPQTGVSGLYQALTYHAGLSGGSWLLSSMAGNDYPTISNIQANLWKPALATSLLLPPVLLSAESSTIYARVTADIAAKTAAGFEPSIIDPWGRLLSYGLLYGDNGGVQKSMSMIASVSNFTSHNAPYPIITALGSDNNITGQCYPQPNATQYEFHPFEFGSWDKGVDAFVVSQYLGTSFSGGRPSSSVCTTHYDQLGYVLGTSSNVFAAACRDIPASASPAGSLRDNLAALTVPGAPGIKQEQLFALYPNPFQNYLGSPHVASQRTLQLVDGGLGVAFQNNPIWPFLHRDIDVIIVNDNSADTAANYPNGSEILNTYFVSRDAGLTKMPVIPPVATFISQRLNQKPTFFGCNDPNTVTIIFIPNTNYTYPSGQPTSKLQYSPDETDGMVANGVQIANYGGKANWPLCLACGVMKKSGENLPRGCQACFDEYCFN